MCKIAYLLLLGLLTLPKGECNLCGLNSGWIPFGDSKCFKVLESVVTQSEAARLCAEEDGSEGDVPKLAIIHSEAEQSFLSKYVFETLGLVDNLWIGATREGNEFYWIDSSRVDFQNWAPSFPTNVSGRDCVVMRSELTARLSNGQWADVSCNARNGIVCQKLQGWSFAKLQEKILQLARELEDIKQQIVPIGSIYAQLGTLKSPIEIWPSMTWEDISSSYAGLFFRVSGGNAAEIGSIQEGNAPRITEAFPMGIKNKEEFEGFYQIAEDGYSKPIWVGAHPVGFEYWEALRFRSQGGEVRPRNTAMRIWRRVK
jgi:hypothetical protein